MSDELMAKPVAEDPRVKPPEPEPAEDPRVKPPEPAEQLGTGRSYSPMQEKLQSRGLWALRKSRRLPWGANSTITYRGPAGRNSSHFFWLWLGLVVNFGFVWVFLDCLPH